MDTSVNFNNRKLSIFLFLSAINIIGRIVFDYPRSQADFLGL